MIYEIRGEHKKAANTLKCILDAIENEWGLSEEEIWHQRISEEINSLEKLK